jgi:hypothetical protein
MSFVKFLEVQFMKIMMERVSYFKMLSLLIFISQYQQYVMYKIPKLKYRGQISFALKTEP